MKIQNNIIYIFAIIICFFVPHLQNVNAATLTKPSNNLSLLGYWSFNEATGTVATDFSGRGNIGTLNTFSAPASASSGWGNGRFGGGLVFDGSSNYVDIGNPASLRPTSNIFTISAWVKPGNIGAGNGYIVSKENATVDYFLRQQGTSGAVRCSFEGVNAGDAPAGTLINGEWAFIVCVFDGSTNTIYKNGVSVLSGAAVTTTFSDNGDSVNIGRKADGTGFMTGTIDEVRVYNRALTSSEVSNLYQSGLIKMNSSDNNFIKNGLVGYWTFDGKDTTDKIYDVAGGNNGYLAVGATTSAKTMGKQGQALSFNGTDREIDIADNASLNLDTSFTISAWIKRQGTSWSPIYDASASFGWVFQISDTNKITLTETAVNDYMGTSNVQNGVWQHVVVVKNGNGASNTTFYLNGVADGTASSDTIITPSGIKKIGYDNSFFFNGSIDDVRLYNRALSASEVKSLYLASESKINSSQNNVSGFSTLNSGLLLRWSFDGADLTDKVYDRSSNNNNGYYNGRATSTAKVPGKIGQGLSFNGTSDSVIAPDTASLDTSNMSVSLWFNADRVNTFGRLVGRWGNNDLIFLIDTTNTGELYYEIDTDGVLFGECGAVNTTDAFLVAKTWYHVVLTNDGTTSKIYLNGTKLNADDPCTGPASGNSRFHVGGDLGEYFPGKIDEVRYYNRALTAAEIKQLYLIGR